MTVRHAIDQYIAYRTNLGGKPRTIGFILKAFSNHIGNDTDIAEVTLQKCCDFLNEKGHRDDKVTIYWFGIYTAFNGFFEWCFQREMIAEIPLPKTSPHKPDTFVPYIYSDKELSDIFQYSLCYRKRFNVFYPEVINHMLKTMYFLGLRPSEVIRLTVSDIHLNDENYALIKETKFYKTRIVPFNPRVADMFESFLRWRKKMGMPSDEDTPMFLDKRGNAVKLSGIQESFRLICKMADIKRDTESSHSDVRLMDFRHTFATNRVLTWYRQHKNVQEMLPLLSAYLGHENIDSTAVYISFVPDLMAEAGDLFYNYHMEGKQP